MNKNNLNNLETLCENRRRKYVPNINIRVYENNENSGQIWGQDGKFSDLRIRKSNVHFNGNGI